MNLNKTTIMEYEQILVKIVPGAVLVIQDWDNRVDCLLKLPNGVVVGEMISIEELDVSRIQESGKRLKMRLEGHEISLVNEIVQPSRILVSEDRGTSKTVMSTKNR